MDETKVRFCFPLFCLAGQMLLGLRVTSQTAAPPTVGSVVFLVHEETVHSHPPEAYQAPLLSIPHAY